MARKRKTHYAVFASFTTNADIDGMVARGWTTDSACNNDRVGFGGTDVPGRVTCRACLRVMLKDARLQVAFLSARLAA